MAIGFTGTGFTTTSSTTQVIPQKDSIICLVKEYNEDGIIGVKNIGCLNE